MNHAINWWKQLNTFYSACQQYTFTTDNIAYLQHLIKYHLRMLKILLLQKLHSVANIYVLAEWQRRKEVNQIRQVCNTRTAYWYDNSNTLHGICVSVGARLPVFRAHPVAVCKASNKYWTIRKKCEFHQWNNDN